MLVLVYLYNICKLLTNNGSVIGIIPGVTQISTHPLNIQEMYELGRHAYSKKNWQYAIQWFSTTLEELGERDTYNSIQRSDVMDYLAYALFQVCPIGLVYIEVMCTPMRVCAYVQCST